MIFSDFFVVELLLILITTYFIISNNIMILLYNAGLYLILIGIYSLLNDSDIYIGFLWVIDLGVGLVFFIFMLHFIPFLHQKSKLSFNIKHLFSYNVFILVSILYFYFFSYSNENFYNLDLCKTWFYNITFLDYFFVYFSNEITELNLLRECYFLVNGFEFFLINFSLFFGLITSIILCFIIHRIFNFLNYSQIKNIKIINKINSSFFIRNQNYITQSNTPIVTKTWSRKRY
jgi:hypothetical protein